MAKKSTLKVAIIGCSGHWSYVLSGLPRQPEVLLAGVAPGSAGEELSPLLQAAEKQGLSPRVYADYHQMLTTLQPEIVAVDNHFHEHARTAGECLARGCHVFCEKPVATTLEALTELQGNYRKAGRYLMPMFGLRYTPWFLTAFQAVKAGRIGKIRLLNAQKSYRLGSRPPFYQKRQTYGGTIPWVGSHAIDWLHWFSGREFISVRATHSKAANRGHGELETSALCHFTLADDIFASVTIDYLRPATAPSHADDRLRVVGTAGVIEIRQQKVFLINDEEQGERELPLLPGKEIFADFIDQVKGVSPGLCGAEDAFKVTRAALLARQAADEQRSIDF